MNTLYYSGKLSSDDVVLLQICEINSGNKIHKVQIVWMTKQMKDSKKSILKIKLKLELVIENISEEKLSIMERNYEEESLFLIKKKSPRRKSNHSIFFELKQ